MHDRRSIHLSNSKQDSLFEFRFGFDPDLPQKRARHLPKQGFHQIEPGAMLGRVNVREAVGPRCQVGARFFRDVRRVIVQDDPNRHSGRVVGIQILQQRDKLPAAMPLLTRATTWPSCRSSEARIESVPWRLYS